MTKKELLARLAEGYHLVEYSTEDGYRVARVVTLDPGYVPDADWKTPKRGTVRAWDVDRQKFTTIRPASIHSMN